MYIIQTFLSSEVIKMELLGINHKRKILKGRTKRELENEVERHKQYGYVEISEMKYFEDDSKPYQILVEKRWLAKENRNGFTKVV